MNSVESAAATRQEPVPSVRVSRKIILCIVAVLSVLIAHVALLSLPKAAVTPAFEGTFANDVIRSLSPQGWAFFTKSPRSEAFVVYQRAGETVERATSTPLSQPGNLFGFDRSPRREGTEYAALVAEMTSSDWVACDGGLVNCLSPEQYVHKVTNRAPSPNFCGDVYVVSHEATPWAWREFNLEKRPPVASVRLDVAC